MKSQKVIAVSGVKNAGKTTLLEKLLPALTARGIQCAVIKHDGHCFSPDREGTDTFRLLSAGACGSAIFDGEKYQMVRYAAVTEKDLIGLFPEADLILLEGFKHSTWPKIEIIRGVNGVESVCDPATLLALVTDTELRVPGAAVYALDLVYIARWSMRRWSYAGTWWGMLLRVMRRQMGITIGFFAWNQNWKRSDACLFQRQPSTVSCRV